LADSDILWFLKHLKNLHCRILCADVSLLHSNRQWLTVSFLNLQDLQTGEEGTAPLELGNCYKKLLKNYLKASGKIRLFLRRICKPKKHFEGGPNLVNLLRYGPGGTRLEFLFTSQQEIMKQLMSVSLLTTQPYSLPCQKNLQVLYFRI